jgi:CheY-like chemotaxis protein
MEFVEKLLGRAQRNRRLAAALSLQDTAIINTLPSEVEAEAETFELPDDAAERGLPELEGTLRLTTMPEVLVVDDDPHNLGLVVKIIEEEGYCVVPAELGYTGFRLLEDNPSVRLLVTDVVMPGLNGLVLADMAVSRRPDLKFLYMTAFPDIIQSHGGVLHGPVLVKPFDRPRLLAGVHQAFTA